MEGRWKPPPVTGGIVPPQLWVPGSVRQGGLKRTEGRTCGWAWGHGAAHFSCRDLGKMPHRPPRPRPACTVQTPPWCASSRRPRRSLFSRLIWFIQSPSWPCQLPPSQRSTQVVSRCVPGAVCRAGTRSGGHGSERSPARAQKLPPQCPPERGRECENFSIP